MSAPAATLPGRDGRWVDRWLSPDRLATYLVAAGGDRARALALYEWNTDVAAEALRRDLCHLEIGLRNAYDTALRAHWTGPTAAVGSHRTWRNSHLSGAAMALAPQS